MQIILTEEEYNKLLQKAGQVEAQVEIRLEEEKRRFLDHLKSQVIGRKLHNPEEIVRIILDSLKNHT